MRSISTTAALCSDVTQWFQLLGTALTASQFSLSCRSERSSGLRQIFTRDIGTIRMLNCYTLVTHASIIYFSTTVVMYSTTLIHNYKAAFIHHNYKIALMSGNGITELIFMLKLLMRQTACQTYISEQIWASSKTISPSFLQPVYLGDFFIFIFFVFLFYL